MSRIHTRVSDLGTAEVRRPTISETPTGWRCEFLLQGASTPNAPLARLPLRSPTNSVPQVVAGSLFECQYRVLQNEGASSNLATTSVACSPPEEGELGRRKGLQSPDSSDLLPESDPIRYVEHSILWQTTGKGDRDFGIHLFERRKVSSQNDGQIEAFAGIHGPAIFKTVSPLAPLSYQGLSVSIDWLVRVRVFLQSGRQLRFELPFLLVVDPAIASN